MSASATVSFRGERLRRARLEAGLSQEQMAERVANLVKSGRCRARNIVRWENEEHSPSADFIGAFARATGKSESYFFTEDDEEEEEDEDVIRRVASQLVALGEDDMAVDLLGVVRRKTAAEEVAS